MYWICADLIACVAVLCRKRFHGVAGRYNWPLATRFATGSDPPPVKWSTLSYGFAHKDDCNAEEELQAGGDCREAAPGRCSDVARPGRGRGDPLDRGQRGDVLPLATGVWWPEERSD